MGTPKETIAAYDRYAAAWARHLRSGQNVAHDFLEKPAMYALARPLVKGKSVLCIGCGTGEECHQLLQMGAKTVAGIDVSAGLIAIARKSFPTIDFHVMDMERLTFSSSSFDLVYSSLTIHYMQNWVKALREARRVLKTRSGTILLSTHHPVKWGAETKRSQQAKEFLMGYSKSLTDNNDYRVYGDYLTTRKITDTWFKELEVTFYHKPFSSMIKDILSADLEIVDCIEPAPVLKAKSKDRAFWEIHRRIPLFLIFVLKI